MSYIDCRNGSKEIGCEVADRIQVAQKRDQGRTVVNTVMNIGFHEVCCSHGGAAAADRLRVVTSQKTAVLTGNVLTRAERLLASTPCWEGCWIEVTREGRRISRNNMSQSRDGP
jgi:hypothetical protein